MEDLRELNEAQLTDLEIKVKAEVSRRAVEDRLHRKASLTGDQLKEVLYRNDLAASANLYECVLRALWLTIPADVKVDFVRNLRRMNPKETGMTFGEWMDGLVSGIDYTEVIRMGD